MGTLAAPSGEAWGCGCIDGDGPVLRLGDRLVSVAARSQGDAALGRQGRCLGGRATNAHPVLDGARSALRHETVASRRRCAWRRGSTAAFVFIPFGQALAETIFGARPMGPAYIARLAIV